MDGTLGDELRQICEAAGFRLDLEYATQAAMIRGIREIDDIRSGDQLSPDQRAALIENLRLVVIKTCTNGFLPSVRAQSMLPRWRFLRAASPSAADAFAAVLTRLTLPIPASLMQGSS